MAQAFQLTYSQSTNQSLKKTFMFKVTSEQAALRLASVNAEIKRLRKQGFRLSKVNSIEIEEPSNVLNKEMP